MFFFTMANDEDLTRTGTATTSASSQVQQQQPAVNQQVAFTFDSFDRENSTWTRWVERLGLALEIFNCEQSKQRKFLLHYMGADTYNILCDRVYPRLSKELSFDEIVKELKEYFDPEPNEILENYRFYLYKQKEEHSCDEFLKELRRLSAHCNFGAYLDTALRNQFVFGLKSQPMRIRLLEKKDLTLAKAIEIAKAMEASNRGGAEISAEKSTVNAIHNRDKAKKRVFTNSGPVKKQTNGQSSKKSCYRCGSDQHLANSCTHTNSVCRFCDKKGHLQAVCFKKKKTDTNQIEEEELQQLDELLPIYEDLFFVSNSTSTLRSKLFYVLIVNNISISFEIDSGAPVTIMSLADAQRHFGKLKLQHNDTGLSSYCHTQIDVLGFIYVNVTTKVKSPAVKLYIVRSDRKPLLGREWLRLIKLDWAAIIRNLLNSNNTVRQIHASPTPTFTSSSTHTPTHTPKLTSLHRASIDSATPNNTVTSISPAIVSEGIKKLISKFTRVFNTESTGKITGTQARLHLMEDATPKFFKARRVPFPLVQAVEKELDKLVSDGILTKVDTSDWATPIVPVPKSGGEVRICGDYKITVNQALHVDEYPLPTINELFSSMAGGQKFSKIDLSKAYLQMEIHPEDRHLLTLSTHKGLYQPTRLMFGVASAPAKFQQFMEWLLRDIGGVSVFIDDIKITAENDEQHLTRLAEVLKRLNDHDMRVNLQKSEFMSEQIEYCGYLIDRNGIHKVKKKTDAIANMKIPTNRDEVRAFLGLINYYGRFLQNLSTILYPMNQLLKDKVEFHWSTECEKAFAEVKRLIQSNLVLAHYDPKEKLVLATDASPYGAGAVLSHIYKDGTERPIQFASQTLSPTQQRYSQIDREAYAIIYGVRKFYQYVYGRKFTLVTDNKPISQIFAPTKGLPLMSATRMQHYAIFLGSFDYDIQVKKSKENANADAMSRLPNTMDSYMFLDEIDIIETNMIENIPLSVEELNKATLVDVSVQNLLQALKFGRQCCAKDRFEIDQKEFALQKGCLMRGIRVYIPPALREKVLSELHSAHFGMTKMKSLARGYCWWPRMDVDIENLVSNCRDCQSVRPEGKKVITHHWIAPSNVFERVHADFAGPLNGQYLFILVDAYSKWPEVHVFNNITASATIVTCREIFATFGIPKYFVSDWGTQFTSHEFQTFLQSNGIEHKKGAPYHPATNGQAERYVQTIKNKLKTIKGQKGELRKNIANILMAYRRSIHPVTGKSPAMLMFGRQIKSRLDLMIPNECVKEDVQQPQINKQFNSHDRVAVRDYLSTDKWKFGVVDRKIGNLHYEVQLDDGRQWKRHVDQMRKVGQHLEKSEKILSNESSESTIVEPAIQLKESVVESSNNEPADELIEDRSNFSLPNSSKPSAEVGEAPIVESSLRRSGRIRQQPDRLQYH